MVAVIVVPFAAPAMRALSESTPLPLLPLGDRPVIQHLIEYLVLHDVLRFELIVGEAPERLEEYLGNGRRWGCRITYHLASHPDHLYRSLTVISDLRTEPWLLVHVDRFPCSDILHDGSHQIRPTIFTISPDAIWGGTAAFPSGYAAQRFHHCSFQQVSELLLRDVALGEAAHASSTHWVDVTTPAQLLETQRRYLDGEFKDLLIGGTKRKRGVWTSHGAVIHPSVRLIAPVYVGSNCRIERAVVLGPHAVVCSRSMIDDNTTVRNSVVAAGTYVGQDLELDQVIADRNLLVNAKLGTNVLISDQFLLSGIASPLERGLMRRIIERAIAVLLIVLLSPLYLVVFLCLLRSKRMKLETREVLRLPALPDARTWKTFPLRSITMKGEATPLAPTWSSFIQHFLPNLPFVVLGHLGFVGLPARTVAEASALPSEWRCLYLNGEAGLITEACVIRSAASGDTSDFVAEACYVATPTLKHQLHLARGYLWGILRMVRPASKRHETPGPALD